MTRTVKVYDTSVVLLQNMIESVSPSPRKKRLSVKTERLSQTQIWRNASASSVVRLAVGKTASDSIAVNRID
jgi:hypothetical protein